MCCSSALATAVSGVLVCKCYFCTLGAVLVGFSCKRGRRRSKDINWKHCKIKFHAKNVQSREFRNDGCTGLKKGLSHLLSHNLIVQGNFTEFLWDICNLQGSFFVVVLPYCVTRNKIY